MSISTAWKQFFCPHPALHILRYHADCVPKEWKSKLLYIDKLKVHNFIQCIHCKKIFDTNQHEKLYDTQET